MASPRRVRLTTSRAPAAARPAGARPALAVAILLLLASVLVACSEDEGSGGRGGGGDSSDAAPFPGPAGKGVVASRAAKAPAPAEQFPVGTAAPTVGTCLGALGMNQLRASGLGPVKDCAAPHGGEIVAVVGLDPAAVAELDDVTAVRQPFNGSILEAYPAALGVLEGIGGAACREPIEALRRRALELDENHRRVWRLQVRVRVPTGAQWDAGARWAACALMGLGAEPIAGGVSIGKVTASRPMPKTLTWCTLPSAVLPCDTGGSSQKFLQIRLRGAFPSTDDPDPMRRTQDLTSPEEAQLDQRCQEALAHYAPRLAEDDDYQAGVESPITDYEGLGVRWATCALSLSTKGGGFGGALRRFVD